VLVLDGLAAQHEHGDVDDREDEQEQQDRGVVERAEVAGRDQDDGEGGREGDRDAR
jgi:hypothetical protein